MEKQHPVTLLPKRIQYHLFHSSHLLILLLICTLISGCASSTTGQKDNIFSQTQESLVSSDSTFEVHFIDVGQADSALLLCDGESMLIDGGNAADSNWIYTYLKRNGIDQLDYIVCTHPHEDHVGGLPGALSYASAKQAYSSVLQADNKPFRKFIEYLSLQGCPLNTLAPGDSFSLGSATVDVFAPARNYKEVNNLSLVMKVTYGDTSFLFTGDAETESEKDMIADGWDLDSTVLKVGHHGGDTSSSKEFLEAVSPDYAILSVGKDNSYGHPSPDVVTRLKEAGSAIYRTDDVGTIICSSDGTSLSFTTEKNPDYPIEPMPETSAVVPEESYICNPKSKVFHRPSCGNLPEKKNQITLFSREEALQEGYTPCKTCKP